VDALKREAIPIIEKIERCRASNGSYPVSLRSGIGRVPESSYGPWDYSRSENGASYRLFTGDYVTFVLFYDSATGWELERID
jgi:hypothetical protein